MRVVCRCLYRRAVNRTDDLPLTSPLAPQSYLMKVAAVAATRGDIRRYSTINPKPENPVGMRFLPMPTGF